MIIFLAKNWERYSDIPLKVFTDQFYNLLKENHHLLPLETQRMMPYMVSGNWLLAYSELDGLSRALGGLDRRTKNRSVWEWPFWI